jgi:tRNA dimethylallyltransferase
MFCDELLSSTFAESVLLLCGPTATGKTNVAIRLAQRIDAEIINCDLSQTFACATIATGQPTFEERDGVRHHLFAFVSEPFHFSVFYFRVLLEKIVFEILSRGKKVIIVGGSFFLIFSLFFAPKSYLIRQESFYKEYGIDVFSCVTLDSEAIAKKNSDSDDIFFFFPFNCRVIFIDIASRDRWKSIVVERVNSFFRNGLLDEIWYLSIPWKEFLLKKKTIGYFEILSFLKESNCDLDTIKIDDVSSLKQAIIKNTYRYGKKQRTFGRKLCRDLSRHSLPMSFFSL